MTIKHKILSAILTLTLIGCGSDKNIDVVAKIGDHSVTSLEFKERYSKFLFETGVSDKLNVRKSILDDMIHEKLLYHYDNNQEIFDNPEYQKEVEWLNKQAILGYLKDQEIYAKITASDSEVREAYKRMNMKVSARHLYAQSKDEADKLYNLLQIGVSFEDLAKQVFSDSTLHNNGGYIGYFTWGEMDPAFESAAFTMNIGETSKPIELEQGFSIIRVEDKISNPLLTEDEFNKKRSKFAHVVRINKKRPSEKKYINNVIDLKSVSIDEKLLNSLYSNKFSGNVINENAEFASDEILVSYKDSRFTENEILERLETIPSYHLQNVKSAKNLGIVIKGMILQDELLKISSSKGYDTNPKVTKTYNRLLLNNFQKYKRIQIARETELPLEKVQEYFENNRKFFSSHDEMNVREIIVDDEKTAHLLMAQLNDGADFSELADKYSLRESSASNDGELGFAPVSRFGQLKDTLWNSPLNNTIGPLQIAEMYGVFEVVGKKESQLMEFDDVKSEVEILAKFEKQKEMYLNYIEKLKKENKVVVNEVVLGNIVVKKYSDKSV